MLPPIAPHATVGPDGSEYVRTLVRVGPGGTAALERRGAKIGARAGDIISARIPSSALADLVAHPAVRFIEAATWMEPGIPLHLATMVADSAVRSEEAPDTEAPDAPVNDTAGTEIGVTDLRGRTGGNFHGVTGKGVVIGIFDTGLDLTHEDFRTADGRSRVLAAWDQTATQGRPPGVVADHLLDYGTECTRAEIDAGQCPLTDTAGHGTHVTGIAAGDGSATGNGLPGYRYTGVAPAADLIVVRGGQVGFTSDQLLDGVAYIFGRAAELGRPAVINLSISTQAGPHDGTTLLERALDALSGPGRIIVAGAGNTGVNANESPPFVRAPIHATGTLAKGASNRHRLIVPTYTPRAGTFNDGAVLELWYDGRDTLAVTIASPTGDRAEVATGDSVLAVTPAGAIYIANGVEGPQAINGDHVALIAIADSIETEPPTTGDWTITITRRGGSGSGKYHLWLVGGAFDNPVDLAKLADGTTNSHVVGSPATADRVLAVGAYASRHHWRTLGGAERSFPVKEPLGDIAFFSSPGPRRDGVLKPEITAPGKSVISARAKDGATWTGMEWLIEEDGVHASLLGTSMAAPFVAGGIALLLQLDPSLTPEEARELITATARRDAYTNAPQPGGTGGTPNPVWGFGKLDVGAAVRRLRPDGGLRPGKKVALSANPVRGSELVIHTSERPTAVALYTIAGERVRSFAQGEIGDGLTIWDLTNDAGRRVANGAYLLSIEIGGERVLEKIFVVRR